MIKLEDECVGCAKELGCLGSACKYKDVPHLYCDDCGDEADELYDFDGEQLCDKCLLERFPKVERYG